MLKSSNEFFGIKIFEIENAFNVNLPDMKFNSKRKLKDNEKDCIIK
jgi:hypothetical protein